MPASESGAGISVNLDVRVQKLFAQTELGDQVAVTGRIFTFEVRQQTLTAIDHHDQTTTRMVILRMCLEMAIQFVDARSQQGDLHFR